MEEKKEKDISLEALQSMADIMYEMQLSLEPIRDKALDEKARLTGYAQCAEQMLKIIATRVDYLKNKVRDKELDMASKKSKKKVAKSKKVIMESDDE